MRCSRCGCQWDTNQFNCPHCGHDEGEVKILTPQEREHFDGITIDTESSDHGGNYSRYSRQTGDDGRVFVRQINFGSGGSLWTKLIIAALIALFIAVVLPVFAVTAAGGIVWLLLRYLKK